MAKVTTEDCRKLLAGYFGHNIHVIYKIYDRGPGRNIEEKPDIDKHIPNPKSWKREYKRDPVKAEQEQRRDYTSEYFTYWSKDAVAAAGDNVVIKADGSKTTLNFQDVKWERLFCCAPETFDTAIRYSVVEDHDGNIYIWDNYLGD